MFVLFNREEVITKGKISIDLKNKYFRNTRGVKNSGHSSDTPHGLRKGLRKLEIPGFKFYARNSLKLMLEFSLKEYLMQ